MTLLRCLLDPLAWLPGSETDIGTHLQHTAVRNIHRAGFYTARFRNVARAATANRNRRRMTRLAMVRRHRRRLLQNLLARLGIGSPAQYYVATRDFVRMKPPIIGLSELRA